MDEAAEDISCNIMPEHYPPPTHTHTQTHIPPSSPMPPLSLSQAHTDMRYFFSAMTIFFFYWKKRKPAGCVVVANLVGACEKKRGYRLHKWPA